MDKELVRKIGLSLASAAKRGDEKAVAKWATKALVEVYGEVEAPDIVVPPAVVDDDLFVPADDEAIYMVGGSPGNPDGVTMTWGQAKSWWTVAFANGKSLAQVRPTLMPGAAVLTDEGYKMALALNEAPEFQPEDWNPLGLEVIP